MNTENFLKNVAEILGAKPSELTADKLLRDFRGWDSMGQMALLTLLDTELRVPVPPNWISTCRTIGDVMTLAKTRLE